MRRENNNKQEVVELDGDGDAKEGCGIDHHDATPTYRHIIRHRSDIPTYHPT
jgi:hypothetical protein